MERPKSYTEYLLLTDKQKMALWEQDQLARKHQEAEKDENKSHDVAGRILKETCCSTSMSPEAFHDWRLGVKAILDEEYPCDWQSFRKGRG